MCITVFAFILIHDCINLVYEWSFLLRKSFLKYITKQIWIFVIIKPFLFTYYKTDLILWPIKILCFFYNKNISDFFFNKKKRFHPYINLCDLIFHSHVQHIIHDMHKKVHWSQESRRLDFVWAKWEPNTFPFHNLASGFTFLV